ncbi:unnamed protein product [Aspergillus oryzae]|uniref:Unnamed protein product n=2 Tax=Aspergillus oryzae TaxID=5062 RepID=A0AAN4YCQ7_ASPOZ|nr:unnamed protein product [Aspergillus oryzae]GMF92322.1 unnamed protein product [Aspergillus oryzae]GMG10502.1 unnamed protein product [Aspergillus oryzae]GMG25648.1 unnamed protein product [Aspergillus oryzae]GMG42225.1 unnamed protein product [Aspergillus oryzae var. brunneus]
MHDSHWYAPYYTQQGGGEDERRLDANLNTDELNTLNIKLFPIYPSPPSVKAWHIVPHINGVNSIRIISILADTDFSLTCRAIRHLLYYNCLFLLDIFSFSAIYAPTAQFSSTIASNEDMQRECARYVNTLFASPAAVSTFANPTRSYDPDAVWPPLGEIVTGTTANVDIASSIGSASSRSPSPAPTITAPGSTAATIEDQPEREVVDGVGLVELYASLKQGQSVKQWYMHHSRQLAHIDIRRFITFGIIKGFLYRVHNQVTSGPSSRGPGTGTNSPYASSVGDEPAPIAAHQHDGPSTSVHSGSRPGTVIEDEDDEDYIDDKTLSKYLDGMHCFDQICTELEISEKEFTARLKRYPGEVLIIHR